MKKLIFIAAYLLLTVPCAARIITVDDNGPADFNNIQAAINDANDGDTVIVSLGAYIGPGNRDLDFLGKPITVQSIDPYDPCVVAATIIDCNGSPNEPHRGFYFHSSEDTNSILEGFTITNGYIDYGGAIRCNYSSPAVKNCIFSNNSTIHSGGAIYNYYSSTIVKNCTFTANSTEGAGGGICNNRNNPVVRDCSFNTNSAKYGGGMYNYPDTTIVQDCSFNANSAELQGGGMTNSNYSNPVIKRCSFNANSAGSGGGISNFGHSNPAIESCYFYNNSATQYGGGIINNGYHSPTIKNCLFIANSSYSGGGIMNYPGTSLIMNGCTFTKNSVDFTGPGMFFYDGNSIVTNCILWGNTSETGYQIVKIVDCNLILTYSDIQGGYPGTGNIDADPNFEDPNNNKLHLLPGSPCINVGDPNYLAEPNETDIDGNPRINELRVDMGADEFYGLSVPSQYPTIQAAIDNADDGYFIIVVPGTYTGPGNRDIDFLGKAIIVQSINPKDPCVVAATVIDCNGSPNEPHRGFYFHNGEDANSVIAGVTITNGYRKHDSDANCGGGIHCDGSSPTIKNCTIAKNAAYMGGGIYCRNGGSPTITSCDIIGNTVEMIGGGLFDCDGSINNCTIAGNYSNTSAGGMAGCDGPISNCIISRNTAQVGGGLFVCNGPITNCTITGNSVNGSGGGLSQCDGPITNCIIWNNTGSQLTNSAEPNYSCIQDWAGGGVDNISSDPCFVDADTNDFHLVGHSSPCYNAGDPNYIPGPYETDIDGQPRARGLRIDIGADELYAKLLVPAEYDTIQSAIDASFDDDIVIVAPGTYTGPGNRSIRFFGKAITVRSIDPCDLCVVAETVIDCNGSQNEPYRGFYFRGEDANSVLAGVTITNGYSAWGAGIMCYLSSPTITNCIITGNTAYDWAGGGILCERANPTITNCMISYNIANPSEYCYGGGMHNYYGSPTVGNCIFYRNSAYSGRGGGMAFEYDSNAIIIGCTFVGNDGGAIHTSDSDPTITNSILWYNYPEMAVYNSNLTVTYSDIRDASWPGPGNINANPRFAGLFLGGLHLRLDSPCINAGDPNYVTEPDETDFDGQPRIMQGRVDMGADEFNPLRFSGDITADGVVDIEDLTIVIDQWLAFPGFPSADIAPFPAGDHNVNFLDFAILAQNWLKDLTE